MQEIWNFLLENERNGQDEIWYQWFWVYDINNLDYSNMLNVTEFALADRCSDGLIVL